jgi:ribosomal protein S3
MKNILTNKLINHFLPENNTKITNYTATTLHNKTQACSTLIAHFFSPINALASEPTYTVTANSVIVHVFYFMPDESSALNNNTLNNLGEVISKILNRPVELRFVKQHYPYLNCYILAQWIASNTQNYRFVNITRRVFSKVGPVKNTGSNKTINSLMPSHIVGIKVQLSGRLVSERSRPRQTTQTKEIGTFSKNSLSIINIASFTTKNKKGAFTIKVWINERANV